MTPNVNYAVLQGGDTVRLGAQSGLATDHPWLGVRHALAGGVAPEFIAFGDDFVGDTINATWATDTASGSTALNAGAAGGTVRLTTGSTSNQHYTYALGLHWKPSDGPVVFSARVAQVSATTLRAFEVGLSNALTRTNGRTFTDMTLAGVTSAASADAAVFGWDTGGSLAAYHALSAKNATAQAKATTLVPSTSFDYLHIAIDTSGNAFFYTGKTPRLAARIANAVTAATLLTPFISITTLSAAAVSMDVDFVSIIGSRP